MLQAGARVATEKADPPDRSAPAPSIRRTAQEAVIMKIHQFTRPMQSPQEWPICLRLWTKTYHSESGCWIWTGAHDHNGYGRIGIPPKPTNLLAHRVAWMIKNGPIPDGLFVCHHCDTPSCVRVSHLFLATNYENAQDCVAKARTIAPFGESNPSHKLTLLDVHSILRMSQEGHSGQELSALFSVSCSTISRIVTRNAWRLL